MEPHDDPSSLTSLEDNIRRFRQKNASAAAPSQPPQGMRAGLRMGLELASGVLVGAGVGILLDKWLGTSPVLCILCFLLGAGGGFLNLYRTMLAMDGQADKTAPAAPEDEED